VFVRSGNRPIFHGQASCCFDRDPDSDFDPDEIKTVFVDTLGRKRVMGKILEQAEKLWNGEIDTFTHHPFSPPYGIELLADKTWFYRGFANTIVRETPNGLIIIDPAATWETRFKYEAVRSVTKQYLHTAVFTHGHADHVAGVPDYVREAKSKGWQLPRVIAHEAMPARFARYLESRHWNAFINLRQFRGGAGKPSFPEAFYPPDITYSDRTEIELGGVEAHLRHSKGETDDHTWVFFPDNGVLCTGDMFIWAVPNAGNPQKVQRYAKAWAAGLREMAALDPKVLAPGHGLPIIGRSRVRQALYDTADFLESLHRKTLEAMNRGASLDEIVHTVGTPEVLEKKPYLQPVYDETEFIVRNIYRLYGGWYDGVPSHLKPAPEREQAEEIARLAGGPQKLAERAGELSTLGSHRLACHLADWAHLASPDSRSIRDIRGRAYAARIDGETSTMATGIYRTAAREMGVETEGGKLIDRNILKHYESG
jgi:alkyl sulfatase BDS1-like metallo-beta-lactamase superfamily hydrolase